MRYFLSAFCLFVTVAHAQGQPAIYVSSYNDTGQIVYICDGQRQNSFPVQYAVVNLNPNVQVTIDSIVPVGNPTVFQHLHAERQSFVLGTFAGTSGEYDPIRVGDDTLREIVYYNEQYKDSGTIIFHARSSASLSMYGYVLTVADSIGPYGFGELNDEEITDTLFELLEGTDNWFYYSGSPATENGGGYNFPVVLRSCGGAIIDSINEVGDFSEFAFNKLPALPDTLLGDDSLVLTFEFSPKVIDSLGARHHFLVFHTRDGKYLTWSFHYFVYATSSVSQPSASAGLRIFPNPATSNLQIFGGAPGTIRLFDLLGREVSEAKTDDSGTTLDVSKLPAGTYYLCCGSTVLPVLIQH